MRYFSPFLLDGSVTTAKMAVDAVTRSKIDTATGSQSGSIPIQDLVTVAVAGYAFLAGIESDIADSLTLDVQVVATRDPTPSVNPDTPSFDLRNESTSSAYAYAVAWRYINA